MVVMWWFIIKMAEEKIYTVPLRKEWLKVPIYRRGKKSIAAIKKFFNQHLKKEIKIGPYLNEFIWEKGNRHPPGKVKVRVEEEKDKTIVELINAPKAEKKEEKKTKTKKVEEVKGDKETKKIIEEKKEETKKAIENVPEDLLEKTSPREEGIIPKGKDASQKKEKVIPKN